MLKGVDPEGAAPPLPPVLTMRGKLGLSFSDFQMLFISMQAYC